MIGPPRYILAPYVPTPPEVVECMLDVAQVGPADLVYDLGCGDGRLAIAAAGRGAHALGVDIEQHWIESARASAQAAGVADRVRFEQCDATNLDLSPANVVLMYLVHWSTQRMVAAIARHCLSGTRVVSHSFPIETGGEVVQTIVSDGAGASRAVHLWVLD